MTGLLSRLLEGLSLYRPTAADGPPVHRIAAHFKTVGTVDRGLPAQVARFVVGGDNSSVLSTLQSGDARAAWRGRSRHYPPRDEAKLFTDLDAWRVDQMRRLGEALAALEPISYDYGYFGSGKSPDWLRHVVTVWLGHGRKAQPIGRLWALAAETGAAAPATLDILFCRDTTNYASANSVDRFAGVDEWLAGTRDAVRAAVSDLAADARAELAGTIGRFRLHGPYLDLLLDLGVGSSKKARASARQALTIADEAPLADALRARFRTAPPSQRAELVEIAAASLGAAAGPLVADWRAEEKAPKVVAVLDRVVMSPGPKPSADAAGLTAADGDGPRGYTAVDGDRVELAPPEPLPEPGPIPADALSLLEPAMAEFNRLLSAGKAEAQAEAWHWSRQYAAKDGRDLKRLSLLAGGAGPVSIQHSQPVVAWLGFHELRHPAIGRFLDDPRVTLRHLVRLAALTGNGYIQNLFSDGSGPVGAALQRRLAAGADIRAVFALWAEIGGRDHIAEHLTRRWYWPLPELEVPIWPVLCQRFAQIDEALGMIPQSGAEAMQRVAALDLLRQFPKLPERYRGPLMLLAGDSSARLRQGARALLRHTPGLGEAIALQLRDGRQETRALAAEWLSARGERERAPALRAALAGERSDLARAAMITALERLGEDVSSLFDQAALLREAEAGLAQPRHRGPDWLPFDRLPSLRWNTGAPVDPRLPAWWVVLAAKLKRPGGNTLINLWLDRLAPGDAHRLGWTVLTGWIHEDSRTPTEEEANAYAAQHVDATLRQHLNMVRQYPDSAAYWSTERDVVFARLKRDKAGTYLGSAADSKGVLALATRVNGAEAAGRVRAFLKDHGSRVAQAKALLDLLAAIGDGAALQLLLSAANRSKQRSVQAHAAALVREVAERNGWTASQLADRTAPTGGLDADGTQEIECGADRGYRLRLDERDVVVILNAEGREVKALPGPRIDDERPTIEAAKKQLSAARKEVKQVMAAQTERLREAMCLQTSWTRSEWESFVAGHPLVGRLAARLSWRGFDAEGRSAAIFRPLGDGSQTDAHDGEVDLDGVAEIRLAHSSLLDEGTVAAWRAHLADYGVEPPFDQFGRDLPSLAPDQGGERAITDREGWMIESFKLRGAATKLGYQRGQAQDGGWFLTYDKTYPGAALVAEIEFTGSPLPEENRPTALQSLSFRKLLAGGGGGGRVALADMPPVLLAECRRDLHDIAAKGSGFDPEWRNKASI